MEIQKSAQTDYPVHSLIGDRWSPRAFRSEPVTTEQVMSLMEAARWAPSSSNEQPWAFIIAHHADQEAFGKMVDCLMPGNQVWAQHAPLLILTVAELKSRRSGKENRYALHDVGLAVANMVLQATALGLSCHQMAGFDAQKAREAFHIPDGHQPVTAIAIGKPGSPDQLTDSLKERELAPRSRRPLADFVFSGAWGASLAKR